MTDGDLFPREPDATWIAVFIIEFVLIFVINAFTLIAFARNQHLRKRTTYLIINLTVADLLVGAVTGPLRIFQTLEMEPGHAFVWKYFIILTFKNTFSISSLSNLSLIALERLHATLRPFRHYLIENGTYYKIIISSWLLSLLLASADAVIYQYGQAAVLYSWISYIVLTLLIILISYVVIVVKVKSNPPPQHFGSVNSDRKLSVTLFIVTVVSILTILPWAVCAFIPVGIWNQLMKTVRAHIHHTGYVLYYASSFVNPLIYAIRMQEFRKSVKGLFSNKTSQSIEVQDIELHAM